jgi:hypothetical protein
MQGAKSKKSSWVPEFRQDFNSADGERKGPFSLPFLRDGWFR